MLRRHEKFGAMTLNQLFAELEKYGIENDARAKVRSRKLLNITRDTGQFLAVLVKATKAEDILEIGTSNGYSTLWLASALPDTGQVTTVEISPDKADMARRNFGKSGLSHIINLVVGSALDYFLALNRKQFDIIFLDAERTEYMLYADEVVAALRQGGLLICDNAISHASEMAEFIAHIENQPVFTTALVPVGKGEFIACKNDSAWAAHG